ncbi:MAG: hypothetical protein AAF664_18655 [Planctomycetota bacterium]
METSLHRQLKTLYASTSDQVEVTLGRHRIDVVRGDELIEVQCASLSALKNKTRQLLDEGHQVRIVKPIVDRRKLVQWTSPKGKIKNRRFSPKRGRWIDLFEDLVFAVSIFPSENLVLECLRLDVEEHRVPRRRRKLPNYRVKDVKLLDVHESLELRTSEDLWKVLDADVPSPSLDGEFGTKFISEHWNCSRDCAQRIAYVLRHCESVKTVGRNRQGWQYRRVA